MAEKMMPYALRMTLAVLANKPDDARSISAECVTAKFLIVLNLKISRAY